jgi:hypothetical protein
MGGEEERLAASEQAINIRNSVKVACVAVECGSEAAAFETDHRRPAP